MPVESNIDSAERRIHKDEGTRLDASLDPGTGKKCFASSACCAAVCLKATRPTRMPPAKKQKAMINQITPHTCDGQHPQISEKAYASDPFTLRAIVSSMTSHRTYIHDITPMNNTKYLSATLFATNQNRMINPDIPRIRIHVSQFRLAHHNVNKKNPAKHNVATLLASVSKPHVISAAPMRDDPRYPAGRVSQGTPPDMRVAPPSSGSSSMEWIWAHVRTPINAWLISWNPTVKSLNG